MKTNFFVLTIVTLLCVGIARADEHAAEIAKLINDLNTQAKAEGGETKVLDTISKKTKVPVATLQAQKAKTGLSYGELYVAHAIASASNKKFDQIVALKTKGQPWVKIADDNHVSLGKPRRRVPGERIPTVPADRY